VPAFSLVVWYNSLALPFTAAGSSYIYGRARSDDLAADAPNPTLTFPPSNQVTLKLDKTRITSKYNEPMVGPEEIVVDTAPFSLSVSLPKPPAGRTIPYAPINYWVPLEFNNRVGDPARPNCVDPPRQNRGGKNPADHIQVVQNGRTLSSEEYQLVTDPTVPTKLFVRPINVRADLPAADGGTTHPVWNSGARVEVTVAGDLTDVYDVALGAATTAVFIAGDPPDGGAMPDDDGGLLDGGTTVDAGDADASDTFASDSDSDSDSDASDDAPATPDASADAPVAD
jgi:hypothetical protein